MVLIIATIRGKPDAKPLLLKDARMPSCAAQPSKIQTRFIASLRCGFFRERVRC